MMRAAQLVAALIVIAGGTAGSEYSLQPTTAPANPPLNNGGAAPSTQKKHVKQMVDLALMMGTPDEPEGTPKGSDRESRRRESPQHLSTKVTQPLPATGAANAGGDTPSLDELRKSNGPELSKSNGADGTATSIDLFHLTDAAPTQEDPPQGWNGKSTVEPYHDWHHWRDRMTSVDGTNWKGLKPSKTMTYLVDKGKGWYHVIDGRDAQSNSTGHEYDGHNDHDNAQDDFLGDSLRGYMHMASLIDTPFTFTTVLNGMADVNLLVAPTPKSFELNASCAAGANNSITNKWYINPRDFSDPGNYDPMLPKENRVDCIRKKEILQALWEKYEQAKRVPEAVRLVLTQNGVNPEDRAARVELENRVMAATADFVKDLSYLHLWADGNGRTRTYLLNALLTQAGLHPVLLFNNNRNVWHMTRWAFRDSIIEGYFKWEEAARYPDANPWTKPGEKHKHENRFPTCSKLHCRRNTEEFSLLLQESTGGRETDEMLALVDDA